MATDSAPPFVVDCAPALIAAKVDLPALFGEVEIVEIFTTYKYWRNSLGDSAIALAFGGDPTLEIAKILIESGPPDKLTDHQREVFNSQCLTLAAFWLARDPVNNKLNFGFANELDGPPEELISATLE